MPLRILIKRHTFTPIYRSAENSAVRINSLFTDLHSLVAFQTFLLQTGKAGIKTNSCL